MKIDYSTRDAESGADFAFAYCECNGSDPTCERCEGTGHIFLPFICVFVGCGEGFEDPQELMRHEKEVHFVEAKDEDTIQ